MQILFMAACLLAAPLADFCERVQTELSRKKE